MTFIPADMDGAVEPQAVPAGRYNLQIVECKLTETGANSKRPGSPQFRVSIAVEGHDDAPNITQFLSLPHEDDDAGSAKFKVLLLKRFLELFSIQYDRDGIDTEKLAMEMPGARAQAEVGQTEPNDNGDVYNTIKVPRLQNEQSKGPARR